jgi:hypothetical protein
MNVRAGKTSPEISLKASARQAARFGHPVGMYFPRDSAEEVVVKDHAFSQLAFFEIAVAP